MQPDFHEVSRATDPQLINLKRRSEVRRRRMLRNHPGTGKFMLAMSDEPIAETAFDMGAPWQRWVAELVRGSFPEGVFLFHRRRGAGWTGDIDIVAILSTGVWVIDIQRFAAAKVKVRHRTGKQGRRDYLYIDDDDCSVLLDDVDDQSGAVSAALLRAGFPDVAIKSVLCLVDVEAAWHGHATVGATHVTKARPMLKLLSSGPPVLDDSDIASLALSLNKLLGRQHRPG